MADLAADKAELVALFVETLLYGIFVVLFYESILILTVKRSAPKINWALFWTFVMIFGTTTGHLTIILRRALDAFIDNIDQEGGAAGYYGNLRNALEVSQASCQVVVSILGDGMVVYRAFVVYNRSYLAIFIPVISFLGTMVGSIGSVVVIGQTSSRSSAFYFPELETWMPIFFGLTFCTSVICTGLIAVRLWYINRRVARFTIRGRKRRKLVVVQRIIIESATMYSALMFVYLVTYLAKTNYSIIFGDMVCPVIGIVFSLITIRVNDAFGAQESTSLFESTMPSTNTAAPQVSMHPAMGIRPNPITLSVSPTRTSFSDRQALESSERFKSDPEVKQEGSVEDFVSRQLPSSRI